LLTLYAPLIRLSNALALSQSYSSRLGFAHTGLGDPRRRTGRSAQQFNFTPYERCTLLRVAISGEVQWGNDRV